jgi:hypothetical protein
LAWWNIELGSDGFDEFHEGIILAVVRLSNKLGNESGALETIFLPGRLALILQQSKVTMDWQKKITFKNLNTITAGLSLINSVFYLAAPGFSLSLIGQTTNPIGLMNTRVSGALALGMCMINWTSRDVPEEHFQRIVAGGNLMMFSLLVLVELHGVLTGAMNWIGWFFLLADSLLTLGYSVILIKSYRSVSSQPPSVGGSNTSEVVN